MEPWADWRFEEIAPLKMQIGLAGLGMAGVVYCFLGYFTIRVIIGLTGFLLAGGVAGILAGWASNGHLWSMALAGLLGGVCGAMALFFLYRAGIFILGTIGAGMAAFTLLGGMEMNESWAGQWAPWVLLGAGAGGGILALFIQRPVMILATSAIGAWLMLCVLYFEAGERFEEQLQDAVFATRFSRGLLAVWVLLLLMGAAVQFKMTGGRKKQA
jgi:hypothetical protein